MEKHIRNFIRKTEKTRVESRKGNILWQKGTKHFKCKLITGSKRQYTFYYSMGSDLKGKPNFQDVLSSLRDSALSADLSLEEIRKRCETDDEAKEVLKGCQNVKEGLERLFGSILNFLLEEPK